MSQPAAIAGKPLVDGATAGGTVVATVTSLAPQAGDTLRSLSALASNATVNLGASITVTQRQERASVVLIERSPRRSCGPLLYS
jgi:hypothetical protein